MAGSIKEVAIELNEDYREALELKKDVGFEKGEKSKIFLNILKMLYERYGDFFGYKDLSSFKSDVVLVQRRLKKVKRYIFNPSIPPILLTIEKKDNTPKEGDGEVFLNWEIEEFGLNPSSYY